MSGEPSPGVRRALAVVLAGHGEVDLLVSLARHDPDENVRGSAMALVMRQAEAGRVPWSVVAGALQHDGGAVRALVLGHLGATAPVEVRSMIAPCLDDSDRSVRSEAFEALLRLREVDGRSLPSILGWLDRIGEPERAMAVTRWRQQEDQPAVVLALVGASRQVRRHAVAIPALRGWRELAPLLESDPELFASLAYGVGLDLAEPPLSLIVEAALVDGYPTNLMLEVGRRLQAGAVVDDRLAARMGVFADCCQRHLDVLAAEAERDHDHELDLDDEFGVDVLGALSNVCERARTIARRTGPAGE